MCQGFDRVNAGNQRNRERRGTMPTYEYECRNCQKKFTKILSLSEHGKEKISCPKCKSAKVKQRLSTFTTKTSRKS
jgi:putative FmdB family regulatory protein